jgi:uncharacterized protein YecE (DUF72 family)
VKRIRVGTSGYMYRHWRGMPLRRRRLRPHAEEYLAAASRGTDVFVHFNDDVGGHAERDALDLLALLGEERPAPRVWS